MSAGLDYCRGRLAVRGRLGRQCRHALGRVDDSSSPLRALRVNRRMPQGTNIAMARTAWCTGLRRSPPAQPQPASVLAESAGYARLPTATNAAAHQRAAPLHRVQRSTASNVAHAINNDATVAPSSRPSPIRSVFAGAVARKVAETIALAARNCHRAIVGHRQGVKTCRKPKDSGRFPRSHRGAFVRPRGGVVDPHAVIPGRHMGEARATGLDDAARETQGTRSKHDRARERGGVLRVVLRHSQVEKRVGRPIDEHCDRIPDVVEPVCSRRVVVQELDLERRAAWNSKCRVLPAHPVRVRDFPAPEDRHRGDQLQPLPRHSGPRLGNLGLGEHHTVKHQRRFAGVRGQRHLAGFRPSIEGPSFDWKLDGLVAGEIDDAARRRRVNGVPHCDD